MLIGQDVLIEAQHKLIALMEPMRLKKLQADQLQKELDSMGLKILALEQDCAILKRKYEFKFMFVDREFLKIEQFWFDDKLELRPKFQLACKALAAVAKDEWFTFKNHRIPPHFTKAIMDAISIILGWSMEWDQQQMLVSDSVFCGRNKDELGLRFEFNCRLVQMMKDFDVFKYCEQRPQLKDFAFNKIMSDARFRRDSYYVVSLGICGPLLVDWIKSANAYINRAKLMLPQRKHADEERLMYEFSIEYSSKTSNLLIFMSLKPNLFIYMAVELV
jgi:hypothetical protein